MGVLLVISALSARLLARAVLVALIVRFLVPLRARAPLVRQENLVLVLRLYVRNAFQARTATVQLLLARIALLGLIVASQVQPLQVLAWHVQDRQLAQKVLRIARVPQTVIALLQIKCVELHLFVPVQQAFTCHLVLV